MQVQQIKIPSYYDLPLWSNEKNTDLFDVFNIEPVY